MEGCTNNAPGALPLSGAVTGTTAYAKPINITTTTAAEVAMHIANALAQRPCNTKDQLNIKDSTTSILCPIARATDYIWQLGLQHPASGLVPSNDYGQALILHFVGVWTTRVLPLFLAESGSLASADLATLSKCILARRRSLKQRGPFWNGRSLSIAEVVVAPFANEILHGGMIPDSREFSALAAWLSAVRASPLVNNATSHLSEI
ncbi:hypothetical protein FBU31_004820 [Coemansia sp. 'formosensis']|nr:hypothetical protein FBU31_004820 [Coemansia sp. 'formosensis']